MFKRSFKNVFKPLFVFAVILLFLYCFNSEVTRATFYSAINNRPISFEHDENETNENEEYKNGIKERKIENEEYKYKFYNLDVKEEGLEEKLHQVLQNITEKKSILFWYEPYGNGLDRNGSIFSLEEGIWKQSSETYELDRSCGYCDVTYDRTKINTSDAVVFHFNELNKSTLPAIRKSNQLFVFFALESPPAFVIRGMYFKKYDNFFNLTRSYRRDADIFNPYGNMVQVIEEIQEKYKHTADAGIEEVMKRKTKLAIWIVSDCNTTDGALFRMQISDEIAETKIGDRFDRRGGCFPTENYTKLDAIREYKFYFSMENGYHYRDYITEKFYRNAFLYDAVPVVWGARKSDYQVPEHSAIFFDDFASIDDLADYLEFLDRNDSAYREYFEWRRGNVTEMRNYGRKYGDCQLCRVLHGINVDNLYYEDYNEMRKDIPLFGYPKSRTVESLHDWVYKTENQTDMLYLGPRVLRSIPFGAILVFGAACFAALRFDAAYFGPATFDP